MAVHGCLSPGPQHVVQQAGPGRALQVGSVPMGEAPGLAGPPGISRAHCFEVLCLILEKAMAPHSSTLVWKIPWTEEPGRLQSMGSLRVGHD